MKLIPYFFFLIIFSIQAIASNKNINVLPSTYWQKLELEKEVERKIRSVLSPIIPKDQIIIDINIEASEPSPPQFVKNQQNLEKERALQKKLKENQRKNIVRINDNLPDELPKDYIIFSKLGLEAPLIDDVLSNEFEKLENLKQSSNQGKGEKKDKSLELPKLEQAWNYNSSIDIFKNLESISATIKVNERIGNIHKEDIKMLLDSLKISYGEIIPNLSIEYIKFKENPFPKGIKSYLDYASKFSSIFSVLLAAILFGSLFLILFGKYAKLKKEEQNNDSAQAAMNMKIEMPKNEEEEKETSAGAALPEGGLDEDTEFIGIKRFRSYYSSSSKMAIILVKKWIQLEGHSEKIALKALVQQLETQELQNIFQLVDEDLRDLWKEKLDRPLSKAEINEANKFISNEIVSDIIIPNVVEDTELQEMLLNIKPAAAADIAKATPVFGSVLTHLLSSSMISNIFDLLEIEVVNAILKDSINISKEDIITHLPKLKIAMLSHSNTSEKSKVIGKITDLLKTCSRELETIYFENIARKSNAEQFKETTRRYFPSELVTSLPEKFLINILSTYSNNEKAEFIFSLPEGTQKSFIELIAPTGSKSRDILDLEFERIENDGALKVELAEKSDLFWSKFISTIRQEVQQNSSLHSVIDELVESWQIYSLIESKPGENLKIAA